MKLTKSDLCGTCLNIRHRMSNGSLSLSIEEWLECQGYKTAFGVSDINNTILYYLQEDGGCNSCKTVLRNAGASW